MDCVVDKTLFFRNSCPLFEVIPYPWATCGQICSFTRKSLSRCGCHLNQPWITTRAQKSIHSYPHNHRCFPQRLGMTTPDTTCRDGGSPQFPPHLRIRRFLLNDTTSSLLLCSPVETSLLHEVHPNPQNFTAVFPPCTPSDKMTFHSWKDST